MAGIARITYGDEVCVIDGEYKGRKGAIVGMNDPDTPSVFTIEFGDGSDAEVPLESLEIVETDIILPPDSLDDENGNCKQCGHPFNPHIIVSNDANDFSKGGKMRCPV